MELEAEAVDEQALEHEPLLRSGFYVLHGDAARWGVFRGNGTYFKLLRVDPCGASFELVGPKVEGNLNEHLDVSAKEDAPAWVSVKAEYVIVGRRIGRLDGGGFKGGLIGGSRLWRCGQ